MKIILTQDVEQLGAAGTLQDVKPGFARNYLIPKGLAQPATAGMIKQVEERQAAENRRIAKQELAMQSLADRIQGLRLTFTARAGESGRLFGSVTSADIAEQLSQQLGEEIDRRKVDLPGGIHEVGEFQVTINLVGRLKPQITAIVNPEGGELVAATGDEAEKAAAGDDFSAEDFAASEAAAFGDTAATGDDAGPDDDRG
jgi:large subunit ribosomal protein L9